MNADMNIFAIIFVPSNPDSFLLYVRQRLKDIFLEKWSSQVLCLQQYNHYKVLKTLISPEYYLFDIEIKRFRNALSQFIYRRSSHWLLIEVGRHRKVAKELNIWEQCDSKNVIENEFHILLVCQKYDFLRINYIYKGQ